MDWAVRSIYWTGVMLLHKATTSSHIMENFFPQNSMEQTGEADKSRVRLSSDLLSTTWVRDRLERCESILHDYISSRNDVVRNLFADT